MDYHLMRTFADSWGLLFMAVFFVGAIAFAFRPGSSGAGERSALIPFRDDE
jgi:cytochrome c oxidase cbb3-type subunit 4